ncbi:FAD-dependent monooxygenase [Piscinibacter terrae]|uniref:2-octaprenyl-3-methyl-6-methoxy-1,4-benzoquinol hydroxylase n=1 Tax=Piscinibacter terrae TaxID=2496871 RepID=A0A3N7HHR2_9BURK|nr:FAD-dependent monooxygenase [Albitalea terrae]RQP21587.1 2-octaprenyl-3-methyl-6-methoxy-1,4-benzoquinol hydroxylase [Albitalea terrae]
MKPFDVLVRGSGIVGQSLALSLARLGLQVALRPDPVRRDTGPDVRAYALNPSSVGLLQGLKVWDALPPQAATPVHDMHIEGDAPGGLIEFSAWEARVGELAHIVDAAVLERELASAVRFSPHVSVVDNDDVRAPLTALCEGKASSAREALGVGFDKDDYGHRAIAARLTASTPHVNLARQWFRSPDVLALLPFDTPGVGHSYGLVWSLPNDRAQALLVLDERAFEQALMEATGGAAGELTLASERAAWPLMRGHAQAVSGRGWVLLGDAAHVVHPLAGQGLNLGLADVAALTQVIAQREAWRDLGDEKLLRRYARARLAPTWAMGHVTDGLLQLFAHPTPSVRELRNRGLTLVNHLSPLKRWLTARALDS